MSFTRKKEDFVCGNCGHEVEGDGYTNHCPKCLWSKHVDKNPGDRQEECGGLMKPVDIYLEHQNWIIVHQCQTCSAQKRNRVNDGDDFEEVIRLEKEINDKKIKG
ncbi:MAG: RNHCP domain-containing protein [Patescibacteria group bacterium]